MCHQVTIRPLVPRQYGRDSSRDAFLCWHPKVAPSYPDSPRRYAYCWETSYRPDIGGMPTASCGDAPGRRISYLHMTRGRRGKVLAIRGPCYSKSPDVINLRSIKRGSIPTSKSIPELYRPIIGSRGDACPVKRPGEGRHRICMTSVGQCMAAFQSIPELHRLIFTARGDACPSGATKPAPAQLGNGLDRCRGSFLQ